MQEMNAVEVFSIMWIRELKNIWNDPKSLSSC